MTERPPGNPRISVVTGAAAGIGAAVAREFANKGDTVLVLDRNAPGAEDVAAKIRAAGGQAAGFGVDVSDEEQVNAVATAIGELYGRVDVLINNAGIAPREGAFMDVTLKMWNLVMRVNVTSVFLVSKALLPFMPPGGNIVNMSSVTAVRHFVGGDVYATAKGAIITLTREMAVSLADRGIRVNAMVPGFVLTEETSGRMANPEFAAAMEDLRPLGRDFAVAAEAAKVIAFVASDDASYINASMVPLDGGSLA